jgi:hypothetical protein
MSPTLWIVAIAVTLIIDAIVLTLILRRRQDQKHPAGATEGGRAGSEPFDP